MVRTNEEQIKFGNDELIEKGNLNVIDEVFATDYVAHSGGKDYQGHEFIKRWTGQLRSAIPDIRVVKIEFHVQAGDTIAWQRTLSGTHEANMMGARPSGQKVKWRDIVISRFDGNKIAEEWTVSELAGELLSKPPIR
ncbi:MAG: ester cyclase [Desulfobacterales bacterium]|nr:ester cyclase [Desulfobacterales bacterium]